MTEEEALALLQDAAVRLTARFQYRGRLAYVVVHAPDGGLQVIGPEMPADVVDDLFGRAAEAYLKQAGESPIKH